MKLFKLKRKNIILVSLLAIAGFLGISSLAVNTATSKETPVAEKAEAADTFQFSGKGANTSASANWNWTDRNMTQVSGYTYKITLYCVTWVEFGFKVNGNWVGSTSDIHSGNGVTEVQYNKEGEGAGSNYRVNLTNGWYDIYFHKNGGNQELYIASRKTDNKTVKFYKDGSSWSPNKVHYFIKGCSYITGTAWPGTSLNTNYGGTSGLYYCTINEMFNGYVLTSDNGTYKSVDITGGQSGDELFFFTNEKESSNYKVFNQSQTKTAGYYIFGDSSISGSTGSAWNIIGALAPTDTVEGNVAAWLDVNFPADTNFKIGYYETDGSITYQNNGWGTSKAQTHGWFTWEDAKAAHDIVCNTEGIYKVYLNNSYQTIINKDFTISCYVVCEGVKTLLDDDVVVNSDSTLKSTFDEKGTFDNLPGMTIKGYYSNEACTTSIDISTTYPTSVLNIYAKCEYSNSVIANNKVRLWTTYYNSKNSSNVYFDGSNAYIKAWIHYAPDGNGGSATEYVYDGYSGSVNNHQDNGNKVRYDYFDVDLACYTSKNSNGTTGWYLTLQRFNPDNHSDYWGGTTSIQLTSSNVGKIYSVTWNDTAWDITSENVDASASTSKVDAELVVTALAGLHTCSNSIYNGYGAFNNFKSAFTGNGNSKVNSSYNAPLSDYYLKDFSSSSYSGSPSRVTNAEIKISWLNYENGGPAPSYLREFSLFGSEDNFSTLIIIISSSVALLSVTALSILVIRKRKSKED